VTSSTPSKAKKIESKPKKKAVVAKKAPAKKAVVKKAAVMKAAVKKVVAPKKAAVKKTAVKKVATPKKAVVKKAAVKKVVAPKKAAIKKSPAKKAVAPKKAAVKKAPTKKAVAPKKPQAPVKKPVVSVVQSKAPSNAKGILIKGATLVTMNLIREVQKADIRIIGNKIDAIGQRLRPRKMDTVVDAEGLTIFPGFIQLHVHLCQTLFRHMAEDLPLFDWLRKRIWPLEAAHNAASISASARLGLSELALCGTTTAFTMETTHNTESVFEAILESGMRCVSGMALMDRGRGVPTKMKTSTKRNLDQARRHLEEWNKGLLEVALCPRFAPSCSPDLLEGVGKLAQKYGAWIHTHIAETRDEVQQTRDAYGRNGLLIFEHFGFLEGRFLGAHGVHLNEAEKLRLAGRQNAVLAHCPSSNMKLGSGIAPFADLLARGIHMGIGTDGAACNNTLDIVAEMRLAALLQKLSRGASTLSADTVLERVTIDAARAIGREDELGSLEVGKLADFAIFDLNHISTLSAGSPADKLIWSGSSRDLRHTIVNGKFLVKGGKLRAFKEQSIRDDATREATRLVKRAKLDKKIKF
jgi:5-methylthioadenosine/S-adenosylhomocysteine deaminase